MRKHDPIGLMKAVLWEEAKGKLRALVAAEGAAITPVQDIAGPEFPFLVISKKVEAFIKEFEGEGHQE